MGATGKSTKRKKKILKYFHFHDFFKKISNAIPRKQTSEIIKQTQRNNEKVRLKKKVWLNGDELIGQSVSSLWMRKVG